jgi:GGDEF domain-containing protein
MISPNGTNGASHSNGSHAKNGAHASHAANPRSVLLIGDRDRTVQEALASAVPEAEITRAASVFDGVALLHERPFAAVLSSVEPIERRPEPAVRALRELSGNARLLLFGHTTLEPLSRKMLEFGCDDYFLTPADPVELRAIFNAEHTYGAQPDVKSPASPSAHVDEPCLDIAGLPMAELMLDAMLASPQGCTHTAVAALRARLGDSLPIRFSKTDAPPGTLSHPIRNSSKVVGHLILDRVAGECSATDRHVLAQLAVVLGKVASLEERHARLQRLAITDDLTGLFNGRYFNHFLERMLEKARVRRFPVTLLLFDIDNFKKYNDTYGHGIGDEILKQTASLMRKCVRDHDFVARMGGDEFAVVFWEKEGPRTPRTNRDGAPPQSQSTAASRLPQTPMIIASRFRRLLGTSQFPALGALGRGTLTISGGMSVFPYDAQTPQGLIEAADRALMFGAKRAGKNSIALVGDGNMLTDDPATS